MRKAIAVICCLALVLGLAAHAELEAARAKRRSYRYGSTVVEDVMRKSLSKALSTSDAELDELVSDHDLFMLVDAARFHIGRNDELSAAAEKGELPVRFSYLDGYDHDRNVLRLSLADDLPALKPGAWAVAPVLLGLPGSPSVRDVAAEVVDDDPLLSVHTCGQILTKDVRTGGVRYALGAVAFSPEEREKQIRAVQERLALVVQDVERKAGPDADDRAYVRAAFDALASRLSYAQEKSSPHYNDVYGALVEGSARCYGLCGALKLVLDARGIPNYIADGTKPSGRHSWNMVWMQGSWRVCDLTLMLDREEGNACLVLEHNFYAQHGYVPDDDCRILELVYSRLR